MNTATRQRNYFLDTAKGVCILMVVVTHLDWTTEERNLLLFPFWIDMAVPVFMMISGYLYARSYQAAQIETFAQAYAPKRILKQILRFTVPFSMMFVCEQVLLLAGGGTHDNVVLAFLQGGIGPGSYYYPIMIQFIFLFPLLYGLVRYSKWGIFQCFLLNAGYELLSKAYGLNEECYRLLVFRYIFLTACGASLACGNVKIKRQVKAAAWFAGIGFIIAVTYLGYQPIILERWMGTSLVRALYVIPTFTFLFKHLQNCRCKPLEYIGRVSFDVFLVQKVYMSGRNGLWEKLIGGSPGKIIDMVVAIVVCVLIGSVFYSIETCFQRQIKKYLLNDSRAWNIRSLENVLFEKEIL